MFFYISFLRTPPHSSSSLRSSSVVFTPQVSNDLRTEPFPTSVDIFYWWISHTPQNAIRLSEPAKLTTWRQENAYKLLQIPPPSTNLIGSAGTDCCLVLSSSPVAASSIINLCDPNVGRIPFPVASLPIRISTQQGKAPTKASSTKQEAITRTFRLFDEDAVTTPLMHIKETISFDLDKKLWDSGIGLSAWLVDLLAVATSQPVLVQELRSRLFSLKECYIIELGAGTGIVSLVLAALRSSDTACAAHETCIFSTDLPSSMELMNYNIRANTALYPHCPPTALSLNWDEEELPEAIRERHGGFDLVYSSQYPRMADVAYNTSSFPALLSTLASLLALSDNDDGAAAGAREPLVLLAYKERDPGERRLWDMMARQVGVALERVGGEAGAGGFPVEIWMGKKVVKDMTASGQ
ncbi:putative methyltransferase-domain-containing protein [Lactarius akahatsu]|uniref:Methyltransferase-domain-containing protein n=1 Tax=Lactarius akahatsu TaxID=416441 RepID=A0AAD4LK86_9AGAM|nr:putative methyltransferase-domain-containing protein [Lactarius akahatsu]